MAHPVQRVAGFDRRRFAAPVGAMVADREIVSADLAGWWRRFAGDQPAIDARNSDETVHLIVGETHGGAQLGAARLVPIIAPYSIDATAPQPGAAGLPCAADGWEIISLVTRPGLAPGAAERVRQHLAVGIIEYGLARGIGYFTALIPMTSLPAMLSIGWDCAPLGLPQTVDGVATAPLAITVDAAMARRLRDISGFGGLLLQRSPNGIGTGGATVF